MESNAELRAVLNELIQTCRDGQEGYRTAAKNIGSGELQEILNRYSLQRAKFAGTLQSFAHDLGNSMPEDASSITGTLHRGWINMKFVVVGRNPHSILAECVRGENYAVEVYQKTLALSIPGYIREMVLEQCLEIQDARDQVQARRDAAAGSAI